MLNTYGYAVYRNGNAPLHVVEISHALYSGVSVFSNAADARAYILFEKESLSGLSYDSDFCFTAAIIDFYTKNSTRLFSKIENKKIYGF